MIFGDGSPPPPRNLERVAVEINLAAWAEHRPPRRAPTPDKGGGFSAAAVERWARIWLAGDGKGANREELADAIRQEFGGCVPVKHCYRLKIRLAPGQKGRRKKLGRN